MVGAFRAQVERARRQGDSYFAALLPEEHITRALEEARGTLERASSTLRWWTVRTFLCQCLSEDHSCRGRGHGERCGSRGPRQCAVLGRDGGILQSPGEVIGGRDPSTGPPNGQGGGGRRGARSCYGTAGKFAPWTGRRLPWPTRRLIRRSTRSRRTRRAAAVFQSRGF